ncbi:AAA family ATPase [Salinibacterium soli]|uniref:AAA family ATPase n=1 Tax=Antiquaquibacter soli TaxID=3064523 RepID=A0ABT9BL87_9MICO|nr:AAA family ATPase [Protaetiibacter sp. WY-16]MDO7881779.1 AAA family ATPase [Protaetiibacter sp. WY-16]
MSDEDEVMTIDLTKYTEPTDLDAAWALVLADAREEAEVEDAEPLQVASDPDLGTLSASARESWAAEDGIGRAEARRRLGLVDEWERQHEPQGRHADAQRSGWGDVPLDGLLDALAAGTLQLPTPTVGMLADASSGLFYPGRVNGLAGESGAGKGWIALTVGIEQMTAGRHFFYLDFEDSPALALLRLVHVLGAEPDLLRSRFHYLHPARHDDEGIADLVSRVADERSAFVVIDSTGESIASAGLNQNHDEEVARWFQSLAHPLADHGGATVLLLDHMVKSDDGGLWPIGSQRKRAAITGAQYVAEIAQPFSRTANGMVTLRVAKDRHGAREARSVASYVQFQHPQTVSTSADGTIDISLGEQLSVVFGPGKSSDQIKADRDAKAAAAIDLDVADLDRLTPPPKSQRDVQARMSWGAKRSMEALQEWRARQQGSAS